MTKRVVYISNRVDIPKPGVATAGGLDELLTVPPAGYNMTRIGWSGQVVPDDAFNPDKATSVTTKGDITYITTDLSESLHRGFYGGTSNSFLWPLFHFRTDIAEKGYSPADNAKYEEVNQLYANLAAKHLQPDDVVVVHDYQAKLVGNYLRAKGVKNPLGFFLHTPAPNSEVLEELEFEQQKYVYKLLNNLFAYDLVGLQSQRDFRNLSTIIDPTMQAAPEHYDVRLIPDLSRSFNKTAIQMGVFPVMGHTEQYIRQAEQWENAPETLAFLDSFTNGRNGRDVDIVSLGRLDYTKGFPNEITALGICIHQFGVAASDIKFLAVAPFGREMVMAYQREQASVEAVQNSINSIFSHVADVRMEKVRREIMLGVFRRSNVGLITPLYDGMNLAAFEFLCAQDPKDPAPLVLSKTAGAAFFLRNNVILVDPMRPQDIARGIMQAKAMSQEERVIMHQGAMAAIHGNSNQKWQLGMIEQSIAANKLRSAQPELIIP